MAADPRGAEARLLARTRALDPLVRGLATRFSLLSSVTPRNAAREHARLLEAWRAGREISPLWEPPTVDRRLLASARRAIDEVIGALHDEDGWLAIYRARFVELARDLAVIDAAFAATVRDAADARFADEDVDVREADAIAEAWRAAPLEDDGPPIPTDDPSDPRSLLSRMRARLSELRLPVRVLVRERVGSLAAAGDGVVIVAAGRATSDRETVRVVVHEIEGHVLPRERGRAGRFGIESAGSAGASEDEEGRALLLEERGGFMGGQRRRSLAARHVAARMVERGATFVDVVRAAREVASPNEALSIASLDEALSIAERVMRGGYLRGRDVFSGLGRERVYLTARARVGRAVIADSTWLDRLGERRLSLRAAALAPSPRPI
ncbi:MAG: DUF1704 domain-containing protein [Deltaproteobacteria bacterium]|nr:DUF1704 domain-containing protein [Deltaproteobacteria bacterium]